MITTAQRRANAAQMPAIQKRLEAAGCTVRCLDASTNHYRITGPLGGVLDFWPSTFRFMRPGAPGAVDTGVDSLLEQIVQLQAPTPPAPARPKPYTNIFCDGSYCQATGAGGWGCWIATDGQFFEDGGPIGQKLGHAMEAELEAIAQGLHWAVKDNLTNADRITMIQSDCAHALAVILKVVPGATYSPVKNSTVPVLGPAKRLTASLRESKAIGDIVGLAESAKLTIVCRHVKGHQMADGRGVVQSKCDQLARDGMRLARAELRAARG